MMTCKHSLLEAVLAPRTIHHHAVLLPSILSSAVPKSGSPCHPWQACSWILAMLERATVTALLVRAMLRCGGGPASVSRRMQRMSEDQRLTDVIAAIDDANACDSNRIEVDGRLQPAELVYGRRMSETLARMAPNASEHLRIAARGQHIERWTSPRTSYPAGRVGYLKWRKDLQGFHARRIGDIMMAAGYDAGDVERVGALVRKERLKSDPDAQMIEDVACVVFLEHYLGDFLAKTDEEKLAGILAKTWNKMSPLGRDEARKLALPSAVPLLLERGLARLRGGG